MSISPESFHSFRKKAMRYILAGGHLYRRGKKGVMPRRVVCQKDDKMQIVKECHEGFGGGHRDREATRVKVLLHYFWDGMMDDIRQYVESCEKCQCFSLVREKEPLHPTWMNAPFAKVGIDIVHMPKGVGNKSYLVVARDDFSGWVEARALRNKTAGEVLRFLWEEVITHFGVVGQFTTDHGGEMKGISEELASRYHIPVICTTAYHPQGNGMVERGHLPLVTALVKTCEGNASKWPLKLHLVLWADRITTKWMTGKSAFQLVYGYDAVLPVELAVTSWHVFDWESVRSTEELLVMRSRQLEQRDDDLGIAADKLKESHLHGKEAYNEGARVHSEHLCVGEFVLLYDSGRLKQHATERKFQEHWSEPYKIHQAFDSGSYQLAELDGMVIDDVISGDRLKIFKSCYSSTVEV